MPKGKRHTSKGLGRVYNLRPIYRRLNGLYFEGDVKARVEWGRGRGLRARRSREFGSYYFKEKLIRIHPVLDQAWVPLVVVESVLHHEMCHQICPEVEKGGRRLMHTAEFRRRERCYTYFHEAERWMKDNLRKLMRPSPIIEFSEPGKSHRQQLQLGFA